jgi:hypothetical protein
MFAVPRLALHRSDVPGLAAASAPPAPHSAPNNRRTPTSAIHRRFLTLPPFVAPLAASPRLTRRPVDAAWHQANEGTNMMSASALCQVCKPVE